MHTPTVSKYPNPVVIARCFLDKIPKAICMIQAKKPEAICSAEQWRSFKQMASAMLSHHASENFDETGCLCLYFFQNFHRDDDRVMGFVSTAG